MTIMLCYHFGSFRNLKQTISFTYIHIVAPPCRARYRKPSTVLSMTATQPWSTCLTGGRGEQKAEAPLA